MFDGNKIYPLNLLFFSSFSSNFDNFSNSGVFDYGVLDPLSYIISGVPIASPGIPSPAGSVEFLAPSILLIFNVCINKMKNKFIELK